jgi:hypothetical protein
MQRHKFKKINQKEDLIKKFMVTDMKNAFDDFINRMDMAEERISATEYIIRSPLN